MSASVMPRWWVDGEPGGLGYFQEASFMPVPGDQVVMESRDGSKYSVEVTHRVFTQPERDRPYVEIHAKRIPDPRKE